MKRTGVVVGWLVFTGFCATFAACSADDSNGDAADASTSADGTVSTDGSTDDAATSDGSASDGAVTSDSGTILEAGARSDGGVCTPRLGGSFPCGGTACTDSTSMYCIYGPVPNTCQPLPSECQCEETFTCACVAANLICDDGGAAPNCTPHDDAGLAEALDASTSSFFWVAAHHCSVK